MSISTEPMMRFDDVGVCYRKGLKLIRPDTHWALRHLNFEVYPGETLGIIGKNGAGKSTLMKLLAAIINPDEGRIERQHATLQLLSLQVGFLGHLSGRENAIMSGMLLGLRKRQIVDAMPHIIDFSELGEQIDDPVRTYSAGMRARLGFAVAHQTNPDVLLIDEALSVGDLRFKEKSKAVMEARIRSDKTVVLVSHNEKVVMELCDRVIWLDQGHLEQIGDAESTVTAYVGEVPGADT
jgi:lipopolysaccharide transport system ATP-binding protein